MSNFSSIGVSVYEITRDWRVTCPFPPAGDPRVHTETHEGCRRSRGPARRAAQRAAAGPEPRPGAGVLPPRWPRRWPRSSAISGPSARCRRTPSAPTPATSPRCWQYASLQGIDTPDGLGVTELRGWLAIQHESGAARATLARRGAAARAFTAFAHRRGWLATDPGPQLGTLKTRRTLPHVLPRDEMAGVLTGLDQAARRTEATLRTEAAERAEATGPADATGPSRGRSRRGPPRLRRARAALRDRHPGQRAVRAGRRATSTRAAAPSGSGARATRNAPCRSACPRSAR